MLLAGGVVGRVQNIAGGVDAAETHSGATARSTTSAGDYPGSSSISSGHDDSSSSVDSNVGARQTSERIPRASSNATRQRRVLTEEASASASSGAQAAAATAAPRPTGTRPVRKFRPERVQGRSWSLEGGELVARGEGGEELRGEGATIDERAGFDRRRGRGGRGRGRR